MPQCDEGSRRRNALPEGVHAIPLHWSGAEGAVSVCAAAQRDAEGRLRLIRLGYHPQADVFLGCLRDMRGEVQEWVEILVQLTEVIGMEGQRRSDAEVDEEWQQMVEALAAGAGNRVIWTGWERERVRPVLLDGGAGSSRLLEPGEAVADSADLVVVNAGGGCVLVRRYSPLGYDGACDYLGGRDVGELGCGRAPADAGGTWLGLPAGDANLRRLSTEASKGSFLLESLYLKTQLFMKAVKAVSEATEALGRPILNLGPESFGVRFAGPELGLRDWCFELELLNVGSVRKLAVPVRSEAYVSEVERENSLYGAEPALTQEGGCSARIPRVSVSAAGEVSAEITLTTGQRVGAGESDLISVQLVLPGGLVTLYGKLQSGVTMAPGEWRLRTLPQVVPAAVAAEIRRAEGQLLRGCHFRVIPVRGAGCDLYSLAVLAIRTFLVGPAFSLSEALDRVQSLRETVAHLAMEGTPSSLVREAFRADERWRTLLGPQQSVSVTMPEQEAFAAVPEQLWCALVAAVARLMPGTCPISWRSDLGGEGSGELLAVYEGVLKEWESLAARLRGMLVNDISRNKEIRDLLDGLRSGGAVAPAAKPSAVRNVNK